MEKEIWKDIEGYEGLYQVSNYGKVKRLKRKIKNQYIFKYEKITNNILKGHKIQKGYIQVRLINQNGESKSFLIHRLVAQAFIPNPNNYPQINHKDENKENNKVDNLEWCNCYYNNNYGTKKERLSIIQKSIIREYRNKRVAQYDLNMNKINEFKSITEAHKITNINLANISSCCLNNRKTAGKFIWKFI